MTKNVNTPRSKFAIMIKKSHLDGSNQKVSLLEKFLSCVYYIMPCENLVAILNNGGAFHSEPRRSPLVAPLFFIEGSMTRRTKKIVPPLLLIRNQGYRIGKRWERRKDRAAGRMSGS